MQILLLLAFLLLCTVSALPATRRPTTRSPTTKRPSRLPTVYPTERPTTKRPTKRPTKLPFMRPTMRPASARPTSSKLSSPNCSCPNSANASCPASFPPPEDILLLVSDNAGIQTIAWDLDVSVRNLIYVSFMLTWNLGGVIYLIVAILVKFIAWCARLVFFTCKIMYKLSVHEFLLPTICLISSSPVLVFCLVLYAGVCIRAPTGQVQGMIGAALDYQARQPQGTAQDWEVIHHVIRIQLEALQTIASFIDAAIALFQIGRASDEQCPVCTMPRTLRQDQDQGHRPVCFQCTLKILLPQVCNVQITDILCPCNCGVNLSSLTIVRLLIVSQPFICARYIWLTTAHVRRRIVLCAHYIWLTMAQTCLGFIYRPVFFCFFALQVDMEDQARRKSDEEDQARRKSSEDATKDYMVLNTKACPECGTLIERNGGCPHMTCLCRYQFHWCCLAPWSGHDHEPGCTHQRRESASVSE